MQYNPHKAAQGYYMLDNRYRQAGYFPAQEYDPHRFPVAPMMIAHPAAHYPQMPWQAGEPPTLQQPVFIANPSDYQQMMQQQRPASVDSEASKGSPRRGSLNKGSNNQGNEYNKFVPSLKKMQLAEIEEMAHQADRMRISEKKTRPRASTIKWVLSGFWNWWVPERN